MEDFSELYMDLKTKPSEIIIGSTTQIIKYAKESKNKQFIIATEKGVVDRLQRDLPNKEFILPAKNIICPNMKQNQLEDILISLEKEQNEIFVDKEIADIARTSINRMLEIS